MPDYFAPSFRVEINGSTLKADVSKNIQQVSVSSKPDTLDTFHITVVNEYPKLRWTHTSDADLFQEGSSVTIAAGYVGALQPVFDGEITQISPTFPDSGAPTLSVEGHTRLHWLQKDKKTRTFQKMTDSQIVQKVAQEAGLNAQTDDTQVRHEYVMQPNQTDLEFVKKRAELIHFEVLVKEKTLIFRKRNEMSPKVYRLVWGHTQAAFSGGNVLPLRSFSPTMNTLDQVSAVEVRGYDYNSKKEFVGRAGQGDEFTMMAGKQTGAQVAVDAFHKPRQFVQVTLPVGSQAEADQQAKAIYNDKCMSFITGNGATIGVPDLKSGAVVELLGVGPRFSGLYYIDEATHTLADSGYQTSFTVKRNSI